MRQVYEHFKNCQHFVLKIQFKWQRRCWQLMQMTNNKTKSRTRLGAKKGRNKGGEQ